MRHLRNKIQVGMIGGNFSSMVHIPAFRLNPRCEVAGVTTSTPEHSIEIAEKTGLQNAYRHWKAMLADDAIDAVSIAVPPLLQSSIALAALEQGKAVFAEKPLAANLREADQLAAAALASQKPNMVDFHLVTSETWNAAKKMIQTRQMGDLLHIVVQYMGEVPRNKLMKGWQGAKEAGGGGLFDLLSHIFHYLEWFAGPIAGLNAKLFSTVKDAPDRDTFDVVAIEFASGVVASVTVSRTAFLGPGHRIEFSGSEGTLVLHNTTRDVRGFRLYHGTRERPELLPIHFPSVPESEKLLDGRIFSVGKLVSRFLDWIETGVPQVPNFKEGLRVQHLLEVARMSDQSGQWMKVS